MKRFFLIVIHILLILLLTVFTQVGGLIWLIIFLLLRKRRPVEKISAFAFSYLLATVLLIPLLAQLSHRTALPVSGDIRPYSLITCLLNRQYVDEKTFTALKEISAQMHREARVSIIYMDANFPFFDGFPLFPHLSHSDGKKLDLAFYYKKDDIESLKNSSFIGYGHYEKPVAGEIDYAKACSRNGHWQYGILGQLIPKNQPDRYTVDYKKTVKLIRLLHAHSSTEKLFLEPYLIKRWHLQGLQKIRFHGCHAVRHDDHIHWQTR